MSLSWISPPGRSIRAALSYLILTVVFLAPLSLDPLHRVAYVGDSISFIYFPIENVSRLFRDPGSFLSAPVAFPHQTASLFEAHRLGFGLLMAPLSALTGNPVLSANVATAFVYVANGLSARWMALCFGSSPLGAWFSGALFAFHTYAVNEQPRPHVLFQAFLPLAFVHLARLLGGGGRRHAWVVAGCLVAQVFFETYVGIFGVVLLTATYLFFLAGRPGTTLRRTGALLWPALAAILMVMPLALAYLQMDRTYDYSREPPGSLDLTYYLATPESNILYGSMGPTARRQQMGPHFAGFVTLGLVGVALLTRRRGPAPAHRELPAPALWIPAAFGLMLLFMLISLGRDIVIGGRVISAGPFGFLYDHFALFRSTRIPERYSFIAMLFAAALAGRALSVLTLPRIALAGLAILGLAEHFSGFPAFDVLPAPFAQYPPVYHWLKDRSDVRAIAEVPVHGEGLVRFESLDMYYGLLHRKPIISGYLSFEPLLTRILRQSAEQVPDPEALRVLAEAGVDTLVVHEGRGGGRELSLRLQEAEKAGRLSRLATFELAPGTPEPGRDISYRLPRFPFQSAAGFPRGHRRVDASWRYIASLGHAALLGDGDPSTQWIFDQPLAGGEFVQINFRGAAVPVSGVVLPLTRKDFLPSDFAVEGRTPEGDWIELARYRPFYRLQLVKGLLASPGHASLGFDLGSALLTGVRLRALPGARSFDGWRLSEIEILTPGAEVR